MAPCASMLLVDRMDLQRLPTSCLRAAAQGLHLLQDLLSVEVPLTLNEAFCEHHRRRCPPSDELERECGKVRCSAAASFIQLLPTARPRTCMRLVWSRSQRHCCIAMAGVHDWSWRV